MSTTAVSVAPSRIARSSLLSAGRSRKNAGTAVRTETIWGACGQADRSCASASPADGHGHHGYQAADRLGDEDGHRWADLSWVGRPAQEHR